MAKKKKQTKKKSAEVNQQVAFWQLTGAIILLVLAFLLLLGGFNTGGSLPKSLFHGAYWALGWAAYLTPIALAFLGIVKFVNENRKIPLDKFIGMTATVVFSASWLYVTFARKTGVHYTGGHGGQGGRVIGGTVLNALDKWPAGLLFFVFAILGAFYSFGISPKILLKLAEPFKSKDDTDLNDLKQKATDSAFQLNEGVPVEHHNPARLSSF
jgi:hypothetical protein